MYSLLSYSSSVGKQLMSRLPEERVTPSFPCQKTGVDNAEPSSVQLSKTRGKGTLKSHIALFIYLSTRLMYVESVEGDTSEAFLAAFHCFTVF